MAPRERCTLERGTSDSRIDSEARIFGEPAAKVGLVIEVVEDAVEPEGHKGGIESADDVTDEFFLFGGGDLAGGQDVDPDLAVAQFVEPDAGPGLLDGFASRVEAPAGEGAE